jgi:hypothetical protein
MAQKTLVLVDFSQSGAKKLTSRPVEFPIRLVVESDVGVETSFTLEGLEKFCH